MIMAKTNVNRRFTRSHAKIAQVSNSEVEKLLKTIDKQNLPGHIAIIMDGNGRWATKRGLPRFMGHRVGVESLKDIINFCCELEIPLLTVYGFSTENWARSKKEVNTLMNLIINYLNKEIMDLCNKGVRINPIGRLTEFPVPVQNTLAMAIKRTQGNSGLVLNLALNYGGRSEIVDAVRAIASKVETGSLTIGEIDNGIIEDHLYTAGQPNPDLLIRSSGVFRLSNFLLWQTAYAEIWLTDELWPDFRRLHLLRALIDYQQRERRFGGIKYK